MDSLAVFSRGISPRSLAVARSLVVQDGPAKRSPARVYRRSFVRNRSAHPHISLAVCSILLVANY
jgi:hypothetical protein